MNIDEAPIVLAPTPEIAVGRERDAHLTEDTRGALEAAVPVRTAQAYDAAWSRFAAWCHHELRNALPATPETLTEYVRALTTSPTERGELPAASSVEQSIAVIRSKHAEQGYEKQPSTVHALRLLKAYRRQQAEEGRRAKKAAPITARVLRKLVAATADGTRGTRNRFLLVCGFYMMARRSELAALNVSDVRVDGDDLVVLVRASKTDQEGRGREVRLPRSRRPEICPIQLHGAWTAELAEAGALSGRLFRSVDRHGNIGDSLSGDAINRIVRELAKKVDFDLPAEVSSYTAHSLRAGGATQARQNGAHMAAIAEHGRWNPRSPVIYGYIRDEDARSSNVMHGSDV